MLLVGYITDTSLHQSSKVLSNVQIAFPSHYMFKHIQELPIRFDPVHPIITHIQS